MNIIQNIDETIIIFLVGYLTPAQWKSAYRDFDIQSDKDDILTLLKKVHSNWGGLENIITQLENE